MKLRYQQSKPMNSDFIKRAIRVLGNKLVEAKTESEAQAVIDKLSQAINDYRDCIFQRDLMRKLEEA